MQSVMQHNFANVESINAPRSQFDRSHGHKFTMDAGWLVPFYWDMVMPGDTFNAKLALFARLSTPLFPIMDNLYIDTHFFFVPDRIIWENSRKFYGEQANPTDSIDYTIPVVTGVTPSAGDYDLTSNVGQKEALLNYLGVPIGIAPNDADINALPFRCYNRIWNEYFRDQNLQDSIYEVTGDGPDTQGTSNYVLKKRGKRADYFTSCLPWPQKGDAVTLPLGTTAPVIPTTAGIPTFQTTLESAGAVSLSGDATTNASYTAAPSTGTNWSMEWATSGLEADLTNATANTINDLREAFQVQKLLERDARGGTRYSELVNNHFGVRFDDLTYRPEYLGGGSSPINISPIAQTAGTTSGSSTGVGDLAAMGTTSFTDHGFSKSFNEHGYVMGFVSIRADLTYQKGMRREFSKQTRYDMYWPSLAHLGEQEVLNKELFMDGSAADDTVFGYQERYAEYRFKFSQLSGLFQSDASGTIDPWHLSQDFASLPTLGDSFITEDPPIDRIVQVPTEPHFIVDTYMKLKCARPMPTYATPGLIDHF